MTFTAAGQPYCAELPAAVLEIVAAEPSSPIGLSYQRYVRSTYLPAVRRIAAVLREHAAAIEWPSLAWLSEKYPGRGSTDPADAVAYIWLTYSRSWETLLAAWDEGGCAADTDRCAGALSPLRPTTPTTRSGRRVRYSCRLTVAPMARRLSMSCGLGRRFPSWGSAHASSEPATHPCSCGIAHAV